MHEKVKKGCLLNAQIFTLGNLEGEELLQACLNATINPIRNTPTIVISREIPPFLAVA